MSILWKKNAFSCVGNNQRQSSLMKKKESAYHKLWSLVPPSTTPCVSDIVVVAAGSVEVASVEVGSLLSVVVTASVDWVVHHLFTRKN